MITTRRDGREMTKYISYMKTWNNHVALRLFEDDEIIYQELLK